jgi:hypothetical protein
VAGLSQGKLHVAKSEDGRRLMAIPERSEALVIDRATGAPAAPNLAPMELSALRDLVRQRGAP